MQKVSNNLIKDLKKQKRENSSLLFLDNFKIIKDAISGGLKPQLILIEDEGRLDVEVDCPVYKADKKAIEQLSDSKTPQGVLCITEYVQHVVVKPKTNFLVLDSLQDPGNVGTLIRTATACGFDYVYLIDSVKLTNSKLVRSSVGTIFKNNVFSLSKEEFISLAKEWGLNLLVADMNGENIFEYKTNDVVGVVLGNEGNGVSKQLRDVCKKTIKIPMQQGVESLNVAVSGAVIMYQLAKDGFNL